MKHTTTHTMTHTISPMRFAIVFLGFFLLTTTRTVDGHAANAAEQLLENAISYYDSGDFEKSIAVLQQAKAKTTDARLLSKIHIYIAFNYEIFQQPAKAIEAFEIALRYDPNATLSDQDVKPAVVKLFQRARDQMQAQSAPKPVLQPVPPSLTKTTVTPSRTESHEVSKATVARTAQTGHDLPAPPSFWGRPRLWTWIAAGAAAGTFAAALGVWFSAKSDESAWHNLPQNEWGTSRERDLESAVDTKVLTTNILMAGSAALLSGAVLLLFFEGRHSGEQAPSVQVGFSPGLVENAYPAGYLATQF